jgi:hypothetical protein
MGNADGPRGTLSGDVLYGGLWRRARPVLSVDVHVPAGAPAHASVDLPEGTWTEAAVFLTRVPKGTAAVDTTAPVVAGGKIAWDVTADAAVDVSFAVIPTGREESVDRLTTSGDGTWTARPDHVAWQRVAVGLSGFRGAVFVDADRYDPNRSVLDVDLTSRGPATATVTVLEEGVEGLCWSGRHAGPASPYP